MILKIVPFENLQEQKSIFVVNRVENTAIHRSVNLIMCFVITALFENGILQLQTSIVCIMHHSIYINHGLLVNGQWSIDHVLKVKLSLLNAASFSKAETIDGFENMALRAFLHIVANN